MSKHRAITGFGPLVQTQTTTGTGSWIRFGPFIGSQLAYQLVVSGNSSAGSAGKVQGTLSTASTGGVVTLATRTSTLKTITRATSTLAYAYIRFVSTALNAGKTLTHTVVAVP